VRAQGNTNALLQNLATELGVSFDGTRINRPASAERVRPLRVGLWDTYGGSMDSGWARWILEQFEFPFERVFAPRLDAGNLNRDFDVLVFVGGGIPGSGGQRGGGAPPQEIPDLPAEYRDHVGRVTADRTLPQLKAFLEQGGRIITIGESSPNLAAFLQLPIENHLVENGAPLPATRFYVPGSVLRARVDTSHPAAFGMSEYTNVFFDDSPVLRLRENAANAGVTPIAWFDSPAPLRSGWAWGQAYLDKGVLAIEARVGRGRALLFTPEILKRAQPHATFKFLFNSLIEGGTD
jgi:hypothetical protein